ncbi:alpha/beta hydrolase [Flavivirga spongiicola]|uniref:Alpha/beta hydrolase n=1 Tax=Flavivirga spongiicola TaxID=421621 RepID=A0ABU7XZC2_9FLAO|nr:alpha/beta hydrolase [Flavivirga sp. MEBiC05379]MDO5980194.1 alpha/beta hydrolase [Flavivirga sp. MEBiC05379]
MNNRTIKFVNTFMLIFLFSLIASSQTNEIVYLWPDKVSGKNKIKHDAVQTPDTTGHVVRLTDVTNPTLTVFKPKDSISNGIGVIVCPGGGYKILAIDKEGYEVAEWLNTLGFTAFVLQYSVPDKREAALYDIQRAIRIIRGKAKTWHLSTNKIGVIGFSAGGSLTARASTLYSKNMYPNIDSFDNISSRPDFSLLIYPAYLDEGEDRTLTSELLVDNNTPPMFIFGTIDDPYGNSALVMARALRDAKASVELHVLPAGGHGYGLRSGNIAAETWPVLAEKWLRKIITD